MLAWKWKKQKLKWHVFLREESQVSRKNIPWWFSCHQVKHNSEVSINCDCINCEHPWSIVGYKFRKKSWIFYRSHYYYAIGNCMERSYGNNVFKITLGLQSQRQWKHINLVAYGCLKSSHNVCIKTSTTDRGKTCQHTLHVATRAFDDP